MLTSARGCGKIISKAAGGADKIHKTKGKLKEKLAERRMLSKTLLMSDRFSSLTAREQMLYVYMSLEADDDGFLGNAKIFMRIVGCTRKNLDKLEELGYIIRFPSGIVVITHWRMNNAIRSDRYTPTVYVREKAMLTCSRSGVYSLAEDGGGAPDSDTATDTDGIPSEHRDDTAVDTQVRLGKDSIGEGSIGEDSETTITTTDTAATENNSLFYDTRTREEDEDYPTFLNRVFEIFEENGYFASPVSFIKYNESRNWRGIAGEDIRADIEHYAWQWERAERHFKGISENESRTV